MGTTNEVLSLCSSYEKTFFSKFDFVVGEFDSIYRLASEMGLEEDDLSALPERDQVLFKSYLFLLESSLTTSIGALRLLSGNIYSDVYALIRILYEIGCIMHYGNISRPNKEEIYDLLFHSGLAEDEHRRAEWNLIKKATQQMEKDKPGLDKIRQELNNFGSHVSRMKVVIGNVTAIGSQSASTVFRSNFQNRYYLAGLDLLYATIALILEEYTAHNKEYNAVPKEVEAKVAVLARNWATKIRPQLQKLINDSFP